MTPEPDSKVGNRVGVFALLVGIAAVIVGQTYRLDLVRGGTYLDDPWPDVFRIVGVVLILLGLAMLLARREQQENLMTVTAVLAIVTALVGGVMLTGVSNDQSATTIERNSEAIDPTGTGEKDPPPGSDKSAAEREAERIADGGGHVIRCGHECIDEDGISADQPTEGAECKAGDYEYVGAWLRISEPNDRVSVFHCVSE